MMERELVLTGIGGQGVQLAAQVLATAAVLEDRRVMLFGVYGGTMRGGSSDSTVVIADGPLRAPPLISHAWSAIVLHHKYWPPVAAKLRSGSVVVVNSSLFDGDLDRDAWAVFEVPATDLAVEAGNVLAASMVMVGAYVALTGLVSLDSAVEAMRSSVPAYRTQHLAVNEAALRRGFEALPAGQAPAWASALGALTA
jgi:2-oxoacid:acceptor oxidoreductase gamma subunit (pyruvate/2-ketoisovalerate family)